MGKIIKDGVVYGGSTGGATNAKELNYDNSNIGLDSTNVQDAIDEIHEKSIENIGIEMTLAEYNALSEEEKNSGTYWITDLDNDISGGNSGSNVEVVDSLDSTDIDKALSANMGRQLKEELPIIEKDGNWIMYKYPDGSYRAELAWTTGSDIALSTAYGSVFISQVFHLTLPQNVRTVVKVSGNSTYLGGGIGGVCMSDRRDAIDNLRDVNFYVWSAQSFNAKVDAHFTCYGAWK